MSRLEKFLPAFSGAVVTDPGERARRIHESLARHLPSPYAADAQRMRDDRVAFRLAIRRYDEQRIALLASTLKVTA